MEEIYYMMILSVSPQIFWHLWIDDVNPCDNTLLPHHQPIRIVHELITYPGTPLPHFAFKNALLKPFPEYQTTRSPLIGALQ